MIHRSIFAEGAAVGPDGAEDEGVFWRAWAFHRSGVLLVRDDEIRPEGDPTVLPAFFVDFDDSASLFFVLTAEQRARIGMSDATYCELNVSLEASERPRIVNAPDRPR